MTKTAVTIIGHNRGFTLIEMMVVISILAILAAVALPSFNDAILTTKLRTYTNSLVSTVYLARGEAIKQNTQVTLCVSTDGVNCGSGGWENGWIVLSGTTVLLRQQAVPTGYKITESSGLTSLIFQPTGIGATQAALTTCRATPSVGRQEQVLSISATGKPSTSITNNAVCT